MNPSKQHNGLLRILLVLLAFCNTACNGFRSGGSVLPHNVEVGTNRRHAVVVPQRRRQQQQRFRAPSSSLKATKATSSSRSSSSSSSATLTLKGELTKASGILPRSDDKDVIEFFRTKANRDLLVTGGGTRPYSELGTISQDLLEDWKTKCVALGAVLPKPEDGEESSDSGILSVVTGGIQFPGLKVESTAKIGVNFVDADATGDDDAFPRYEFVLLETTQKASGLPPAVYVFNKLTGADDDKKKDGSPDDFASLTTVTCEESGDSVVFRTNAKLSLGVTFPKFLLRILPGDKATIEARGGKSIVKTLEKDVAASMEAFQRAYDDYCRS